MYHVLYTTCHLNHQQRLSGNNFPLLVGKEKDALASFFYDLRILIRLKLFTQGIEYNILYAGLVLPNFKV